MSIRFYSFPRWYHRQGFRPFSGFQPFVKGELPEIEDILKIAIDKRSFQRTIQILSLYFKYTPDRIFNSEYTFWKAVLLWT